MPDLDALEVEVMKLKRRIVEIEAGRAPAVAAAEAIACAGAALESSLRSASKPSTN